MEEKAESGKEEMTDDVKHLLRDIILLSMSALLILSISSFFRGSPVHIFGRDYALEVVLLALFALVFIFLTSLIFYDLKKMVDTLTSEVIKNFPGMQEEVPPMTAVMRSLVQIIVLFLLSVVLIPLTAGVTFLGISLSTIVSTIILILVGLFVYVIVKNIINLARGYVGNAVGRFFRQESLLLRRGRRRRPAKSGEEEGS